jgi:hypothetical protein
MGNSVIKLPPLTALPCTDAAAAMHDLELGDDDLGKIIVTVS